MQPTHEEHWRAIPGWEGRYEVSDQGRVRSLTTWSRNQFGALSPSHGKVRALLKDRRGYWRATLYRDNTQKRYAVHQLVMLAFVGPPPSGQEVCHNNGNPGDNRLVNLRYDTHSANLMDKVEHGTHSRGEQNGNNRHSEDDILRMRSLYRSGGYSQREIGEMYGIRQAAVSGIINGKSWAWLSA